MARVAAVARPSPRVAAGGPRLGPLKGNSSDDRGKGDVREWPADVPNLVVRRADRTHLDQSQPVLVACVLSVANLLVGDEKRGSSGDAALDLDGDDHAGGLVERGDVESG